MGYEMALKAAGAKVHKFKYYGDYQGNWIADVTYRGRRGFIFESYGSCSGCDEYCSLSDDHDGAIPMSDLKKFGELYLEKLLTFEELVAEAKWSFDIEIDDLDTFKYLR